MSLVVVRSLGLVTVQDLGRPGRMHEALPPGGALVPSMLVRANRAVGNPGDAAAIEVCGQLVVRAESGVRIAIVGGAGRADVDAGADARVDAHVGADSDARVDPRLDATVIIRDLGAGNEAQIASGPRRVAYLAVRGGLDAPVTLGARSAHLSAGIGQLLRAGDRLAIGAAPAGSHDPPRDHGPSREDARSIRVIPGPDLQAFDRGALEQLLDIEWRLGSSSNRVGTRLEGAAIARRAGYVETSRPMVIGAIEVPRDGAPIVLGPEHPTTGGYPLVAVVASEDLDAFHAIPLGGAVRFRV